MQEEQVCEAVVNDGGFKRPSPKDDVAFSGRGSCKRPVEENDLADCASKKARNICVFDDVAERTITINDTSSSDEGGYCVDDDEDEEETDEDDDGNEGADDDDDEGNEDADDELCRSIVIVDD
jgi:hypothetical protein